MSPLIPILAYTDARAAIDFACEAFGAERLMVVDAEDGTVAHSELRLAGGVLMIAQASDGSGGGPAIPPGGTLYATVDDPDALCERATRAGAEIVRGLDDTDYGSREFSVRDPQGVVWNFGTYVPAVEGGA
jgi:uncharacterized glyoxalase superfamily protein PhnB